MATLSAPVEIEDDDRELGAALLAERSPEDIAALLVRAHRAKMPAPEEMAARGEAPARMDGPRPGFEDTVWFKMNVGRRHNADARWLLPLLCRRGHITKAEIGAIRIAQDETAFEIPRAVASRFVGSVPSFDSFGHVRFFHDADEVAARYRDAIDQLVVQPFKLSPNAILFLMSGVVAGEGSGA